MATCSFNLYGEMECWNTGILGIRVEINYLKLSKNPSNPSFHYSIIPIGEKPLNSGQRDF
jgi:hypothetical protein